MYNSINFSVNLSNLIQCNHYSVTFDADYIDGSLEVATPSIEFVASSNIKLLSNILYICTNSYCINKDNDILLRIHVHNITDSLYASETYILRCDNHQSCG